MAAKTEGILNTSAGTCTAPRREGLDTLAATGVAPAFWLTPFMRDCIFICISSRGERELESEPTLG